MATGSEILNYTGNVGLGLNDSVAVQYGDTDTKDLSNSIFNLAYLNMQKNKEVWQQKIRERDDAMELIAAGQLQLNDALSEDRDKLMGMVDEVKNIFYNNGGDIKSDPKVWLDINGKLAKFKSANVISQSRLKEYTKGIDEAAKETNPIRKQKMLDHWEGERRKDLTEPILPYQQQMDWDAAKVLTKLKTLDSSPVRDGYNDVTTTRTDITGAYTEYINRYQYDDKGETAPNIDAFYKNYIGADGLKTPEAIYSSIDLTNAKIKKIAEAEGYDTTKIDSLPEYLKPIKAGPDPAHEGQIKTIDRPEQLAFKVALALDYKNQKTSVPNLKYADIDLKKAQAAAAAKNADSTRMNAQSNRIKALSDRGYKVAQTKKITSQMQAANEAKAENPWQAIPQALKVSKHGSMYIDVRDVTPGVTALTGGAGPKGEPLALMPEKLNIVDKDSGAKIKGWLFNPIKKWFTPDGIEFSEVDLAKQAAKKKISLDKLISNYIETGILYQDGEIKTSKGKGTRLSMMQAAKQLNNKIVGKGDENTITNDDGNNDEDSSQE